MMSDSQLKNSNELVDHEVKRTDISHITNHSSNQGVTHLRMSNSSQLNF